MLKSRWCLDEVSFPTSGRFRQGRGHPIRPRESQLGTMVLVVTQNTCYVFVTKTTCSVFIDDLKNCLQSFVAAFCWSFLMNFIYTLDRAFFVFHKHNTWSGLRPETRPEDVKVSTRKKKFCPVSRKQGRRHRSWAILQPLDQSFNCFNCFRWGSDNPISLKTDCR